MVIMYDLIAIMSTQHLFISGHNGRHFADDTFSLILMTEMFWILIKISLKFVPRGPIDNNPALV